MQESVNMCRVLYRGEEGGLHTYDGSKIVFQHRENENKIVEGLGVVVEGTFRDLGTYGFADFKNIEAVEPKEYRKIAFYSWRGVPQRILKGSYGTSVFFKEEYIRGTYIRAYTEDGVAILYERDTIKKENYKGENKYYTRLDALVEDWVDITEDVRKALYQELREIDTTVDLTNPDVKQSLENIYKNGVTRLENGVILGKGRYENLALWATALGHIETAWLGVEWDADGLDKEDITEDIREIITAEVAEIEI